MSELAFQQAKLLVTSSNSGNFKKIMITLSKRPKFKLGNLVPPRKIWCPASRQDSA